MKIVGKLKFNPGGEGSSGEGGEVELLPITKYLGTGSKKRRQSG